jgi:glutaconate CoA-transferase subunit B
MLRQNPRAFVEQVDFITSVGYGPDGNARERLGLPGRGPTAIITDIGVLRPDPNTHEFILTEIHPGCTVEQAREATGWDLRVAPNLHPTAPPTTEELANLRKLKGEL